MANYKMSRKVAVKKDAKQTDMFPARKKLAEQAHRAQVMGKLKLPTIEEVYAELKRTSSLRDLVDANAKHVGEAIDYLKGFTKSDSDRLTVFMAHVNDRLENVERIVRDVTSASLRMAEDVDNLMGRTLKPSVITPPKKQWTSEEYIRLSSEYDLMLHVDNEVDMEVLADIHDCTYPELHAALKHLGKRLDFESTT